MCWIKIQTVPFVVSIDFVLYLWCVHLGETDAPQRERTDDAVADAHAADGVAPQGNID